MPAPRKPTALLELRGAFDKDPRAAPLARIAPAKVLTGADRWLVEVCCKVMAKVRADGIGGRRWVSVGELSQLMAGLRTMGPTPADRSKISVPPDEEAANPFTESLQEGS